MRLFFIFHFPFSIFHFPLPWEKENPTMRFSRCTSVVSALTALLGLAALAWSQAKNVPTVEQMLSIKPVQKGIAYTTPTAAEFGKCKVEVIDGAAKGTSGFVLRDAQGQMLRKFFDSNA